MSSPINPTTRWNGLLTGSGARTSIFAMRRTISIPRSFAPPLWARLRYCRWFSIEPSWAGCARRPSRCPKKAPLLRSCPEISVTTSCGQPDGVVPLAVELCGAKIYRRQFVVGDFDSGRVAVFVQRRPDAQSCFGRGFRDQRYDDLVAG